MTKIAFEVLALELAATGAIPTGTSFWQKNNSIREADFGIYLVHIIVIRSVS